MKLDNALFTMRCLMAMLILIVSFKPSFSQVWSPLGAGTNGNINAVFVYNNELIAGGDFTTAGGQIVNHVAKWNGTNWQPLGLGTNDAIFAFTYYNGYLIAGGKFSTAGGIASSKVARWNGSNWSAVSSAAINGDIRALSVLGSNLVAGGNFTNIGVTMNRIAVWNGNSWQPFGNGFNSDVFALATFNTLLFSGGSFVETYGKRISSWNGSNWTQVGVGIDDGSVYALRTYGTSLVVSGTFTLLGGTPVNRVARWTGSSWAPLGSGFDRGVYALYASGTYLYAGGVFDFADFLPASRVAVYSGSGWSGITSGVTGPGTVVNSITGFGGRTVFAGKFSIAGGNSANNIAVWGAPLGIIPVEGPVPDKYLLEQNYPNPFNPSTKIRFGLPSNSNGGMHDVKIIVFDILGKEISVFASGNLSPGKYEIEFDGTNLPSGTYFYKLISDEITYTKRMVLLK